MRELCQANIVEELKKEIAELKKALEVATAPSSASARYNPDISGVPTSNLLPS